MKRLILSDCVIRIVDDDLIVLGIIPTLTRDDIDLLVEFLANHVGFVYEETGQNQDESTLHNINNWDGV